MRRTPLTNTFGAYDAKSRFSELLERVEKGQSLTITKHGTPVARLVPVSSGATPQERRDAIDHWRETSRGLSLGGLKIADLVREGRR